MQTGKVMVVGSANMDLVFRTPRFPVAGETVLGEDFATFPGGKGANQAVAAARLGADVRFLGKVGSDAFGDALAASIGQSGVRLDDLLRAADAPTGVAAILVDQATGQNCIVAAPGANMRLEVGEVQKALAGADIRIVLAQLESPLAAIEAIPDSMPNGAMFILNPAPFQPVPASLLSRVDVITPNETEAEALTGVLPVDDATCRLAAASLLDRGVGAVVITLGERGCYFAAPAGGRHVATLSVAAVDTTAAGDCFNGALAAFLAEGRGFENALQLANCVGALSTTKAGAQTSAPSRDELEAVAAAYL